MKIRIRKEELERALNKVACALGDKNEDVTTKNVGIEVLKDSLRFVASSHKICAEYKISVGDNLVIEESDKIVVDGDGLIRNISNFHSGVMVSMVSEKKDAKTLTLSYNTKHDEPWEHTHNLLDSSYFPEINFEWPTEHSVVYPAARLINWSLRAISAASDEEHRADYNAVMIGFGKVGVEFFASDGRQMAYINDKEYTSEETKKALIQSQIISKVTKRSILENNEDVEISINERSEESGGKVRFRQNGLTIITNFSKDAKLLPYEKILKLGKGVCSFSINAGLLKDDLKVFSDLQVKDSTWSFSSNGIKISSLGNFDRKSHGSVSGITNFDGKECQMILSLKYWDNLLSKCDGNSDLKVNIASIQAPICIEASPEPALYKFYIMPITDVSA